MRRAGEQASDEPIGDGAVVGAAVLWAAAVVTVSSAWLARDVSMAVDALLVCSAVVGPAAAGWLAARWLGGAGGVAAAVVVCVALQTMHAGWPEADLWARLLLGGLVVAAALRAPLRRWLHAALRPGSAVRGLVAAVSILVAHQYASFLVPALLGTGQLHQDTLFHASIAAMLKNCGIASTGIHGLVPIGYHVLLHRVVAGMSALSGVPVIRVLPVLEMVVLSPMLVAAAAWAASRIGKGRSARHTWSLVCIVLLAVPVLRLGAIALWDSWFVSESYTLSLVLLAFAMPSLLDRRSSPTNLLGAAMCVALAGLAKVSVGGIGLALLGVRVITADSSDRRALAVAAVVVSAAVLAIGGIDAGVEGAVSAGGVRFGLLPYAQLHAWHGDALHGMSVMVQRGTWPSPEMIGRAFGAGGLFLLVQLGPSMLAVALAWRRPWGNSRAIAWIVLLSGLVAVSLDVVGAFYCINPSWFVGTVLSASIVADQVRRPRVLLVMAMLLAGLALVIDASRDRAIASKTAASAGAPAPGGRERVAALLELQRSLDSIRHAPQGPDAVLVPDERLQALAIYWSCTRRPFVFPAVTEIPWVGLLEPGSGCRYTNYGYEACFSPDGELRAPVLPPGYGPPVLVPR